MNTIDWSAEFIMQSVILGMVSSILYDFSKAKLNKLRNVKFEKTMIHKILGFIFGYILPLGVIGYNMIDNKMPTTFRSFGYFTIVVGCLVYNLLISHIRSLYAMGREVVEIASQNDETHRKAINKICEILNLPKAIK